MFWETAVQYLHSQKLLFNEIYDDVNSILFLILRGWTSNRLLFYKKEEKKNFLLYLSYTTVKQHPAYVLNINCIDSVVWTKMRFYRS